MSVQIIKQVGLRSALAVAVASAMLSGCGSSSSESGGGGVINLSGGNGGSGAGGTGGGASYFQVDKYTSTGDLVVKSSGSANTAFTVHTATAELGTAPLVVKSNTDLAASVLASCAATPPTTAGTPYMAVGTNTIYLADGTATACTQSITGLQVNAGVTLKLALNSGSTARVWISNDIDNRGTITSADASATNRGRIDLRPGSYIGSGTITTAGTASVPNGGDIYIYPSYAILNSGAMIASGGDVTTGNGGYPGYVELYGNYYTQNTGKLMSNGGNTTDAAGVGGNGNYAEVYTRGNGSALNSGNLYVQGGNGPAGGGSGGEIYLDNDYVGDVVNSGDIYLNGGDATTAGNGGSGGDLQWYVYGGESRNSGQIFGNGGKAAGSAGNGGTAAYVDIYAYDGDCGHTDRTEVGDITWSGSINLKGGDALATGTGSGGAGNSVYVYTYNDQYCTPYSAKGTTVSFLGYSSMQQNGGSGDQGGNGDAVYLYQYGASFYDGNTGTWFYAPGGNVEMTTDFQGHGGDAVAAGASTNGYGGNGANYMDLETTGASYHTADAVNGAKVTVNGNWDISGGKSRNSLSGSSGRGGDIDSLWGFQGVTFNGTITANGGKDTGHDGGTDGYGGGTRNIYMYAETGPVTVGTIYANGGDGEYAGGWGGYIDLLGNTVTASAIYANGGNADTTLTGSTGGNGGDINLDALSGATIGASGYKGGAGKAAAGTDGYLWANNCQGVGC